MDPPAAASFRKIRPCDDHRIAGIVRDSLCSFGCDGPDSPAGDAELACMSAAYSMPDARYYVVTVEGEVLGGGGFAPLLGTPHGERTCELRKMYFAPGLRGRGVGTRFLAFLLDAMRDAGYERVYLETVTQMVAARRLYARAGFVELDHRMGATGRAACDRPFVRSLAD